MIIRVDPAILRQSSGTISGVGTNVTQTGQNVLNISRSAPSYDGQFGPQVQSMGNEALSRAQGLSSQVSNQSGILQSRAQGFEAADMAGAAGFQSSTYFPEGPNSGFFNISSLTDNNLSGMNSIYNLGNLGNPNHVPNSNTNSGNFWTGQVQPGLTTASPVGSNGGKKDKLGIDVQAAEGSYWNNANNPYMLGGVIPVTASLFGGAAGFGTGLDDKGNPYIGVYGDAHALELNTQGDLIGNKNLGLGAEGTIDVGGVNALLGYKDGEYGIGGEAYIVKAEGAVGLNLSGYDVGLTGGIGLGWGFGFEVGKDTKLELGPFEIGLNISQAL